MNPRIHESAAGAWLQPFLDGRLVAWLGLPEVTVSEMAAALGPPNGVEAVTLGYYPAWRHEFQANSVSGGVRAYVRDGWVVLIESVAPQRAEVMQGLPEPNGILPQELLVSGHYAHEYVYCSRGLVVTVAKPLSSTGEDQIVRYRGVRQLGKVQEFGPDYYQAFDDQIRF
jgi:hypothetical protein